MPLMQWSSEFCSAAKQSKAIDRLSQGKKWIRSSWENYIGTWSKRSRSTGCAMPMRRRMLAAVWASCFCRY